MTLKREKKLKNRKKARSAHQNYSALLFIFLSGVNAQKKNIHHLFWKPLFFTTKNISLSQETATNSFFSLFFSPRSSFRSLLSYKHGTRASLPNCHSGALYIKGGKKMRHLRRANWNFFSTQTLHFIYLHLYLYFQHLVSLLGTLFVPMASLIC